MGIETRRTKIGDTEYELTVFGAKTGYQVLIRMFRIIGPAAAVVLSSGTQGLDKAIGALATSLNETDVDFIVNALANQTQFMMTATTQAGPQALRVKLADQFDNHFSLRYDEWALWLGWGIRENFASFFAGKAIGDLLAKFMPKAEGEGTEAGSESPKV